MSTIRVKIDEQIYDVHVSLDPRSRSEATVEVDGEFLPVKFPNSGKSPGQMEWIVIGNRPYELIFDCGLRWVGTGKSLYRIEVRDLEARSFPPRNGDCRIKAPIPGLITRIMIDQGSHVDLGQPLMLLEAMKMENEIRSPFPGIVRSLKVNLGQSVAFQEVLAEIF